MSKRTCSASDKSDEDQEIATFEKSAGKAKQLQKNKGNIATAVINKHHAHQLSGNYLQERDFDNIILCLPDLPKTLLEEEEGFGTTQSTVDQISNLRN